LIFILGSQGCYSAVSDVYSIHNQDNITW
jgi:hypothetical protein